MSPVHVGRDEELARVQAVVSSPPSLAVIEGEAGIGKSRLVRELAARLRSEGTLVLIGHCEHLHEPLPLGPLLDMFSHYADQIVANQLNPVVGALAPLVPELADRLPPPPPALSDQRAARHRVFRAATCLLEHLGPTVLVLEDLHWADSGTYDFLTFLASHHPEHLGVVVTARSEHGGPLPVAEAFARARFGPPVSIRLRPLAPQQVGQLAQGILQVDLPDPVTSVLYHKTGGIPFVVEEVLRTLLERLPPSEISRRPDALDDLAVPTALRDVVRQRMAVLDPVATEILGVAAVMDLTVDADLLARCADRTPAEVAAALADAQAAGLLQEVAGQCSFRHVLAQQIVYEAVPAPTRRWLHRRIAGIIERYRTPRPVARLAHHYDRAGDMDQFVRNAEQAADLATSHGDDATAARFLLQATGVSDLPLDARLRLATKLGRAAVDGLAQTEAVPILRRLLAGVELPAVVRGELRFALGRLLRQQGLAQAGYREIENAVSDLAESPALLARALAVLAAPDTVVDRHISTHVLRCDEAEAAARRSGSREVGLAVQIARASLLLERGDPGGWTLIERLRRGALRAHPREHARACVNWAQGAVHIGHVRRAGALLAEGRRVAEQVEYLRIAEVFDFVAATIDCAAGRWQGLRARARDLAYQASHFAAASLDGQLVHGTMLAAAGSSAEAVPYLRDLVAAAQRVGAVWPLLPARTVLARLLLTIDDAAASAEQAGAALAEATAKGNGVWAAEPALCLVDALAALGRRTEIPAVVAELSRHVAHVDAPAAQAALRGCQAIAAHEDGDATTADSLLETARGILTTAGLRYEEARAAERQGRWRCERGTDEGPAMLEYALRSYGELQAARDIARVCRTMRHHGVPVPYPWRGGRRSHGLQLSTREREVALLAAAGRTNREIAADLLLSPRTVESHISSALRKLGCQSRSELASRIS